MKVMHLALVLLLQIFYPLASLLLMEQEVEVVPVGEAVAFLFLFRLKLKKYCN
jgi:hypothetical protein